MIFKFCVSLLILVTLANSGECKVECYRCKSKGNENKKCANGAVLRKDEASGLPVCFNDYCVKAFGLSNGNEYTIRDCSSTAISKDGEFEFNKMQFQSGEVTSCSSRLCNSSLTNKINIILIVFVIIVDLMFFIY